MNPELPSLKHPAQHDWEWPASKFQLPRDALFTTLHERFNTRTCAIQDPRAFHLDVRDCSEESATVDEFYAKLSERREKRLLELERAWEEIATIGAFPSTWDFPKRRTESINDSPSQRWGSFCQFASTMSFDSLVRFFDGFVREERERQEEERRRIRTMEEIYLRQQEIQKEISLKIKMMQEQLRLQERIENGANRAGQSTGNAQPTLPISPESRNDYASPEQEETLGQDDQTGRQHLSTATATGFATVTQPGQDNTVFSTPRLEPSSSSFGDRHVTKQASTFASAPAAALQQVKRRNGDVPNNEARLQPPTAKRQRTCPDDAQDDDATETPTPSQGDGFQGLQTSIADNLKTNDATNTPNDSINAMHIHNTTASSSLSSPSEALPITPSESPTTAFCHVNPSKTASRDQREAEGDGPPDMECFQVPEDPLTFS